MSQLGKYESFRERPFEGKDGIERHLMRTLLSSVVSLLLCSTMFLSTTMAWFTDTVTSSGNQIVVGELNVDVKLDGASLKNSNKPIFSGTVWAPDMYVVRTLTVENQGSLDIVYTLNFSMAASTGGNGANIAKYMQVFVKDITSTHVPANGFSLEEVQGWGPVGGAGATLADVFEKGISGINDGSLPAAAANGAASRRTYAVALYMKNNLPAELMGEKLDLNIILNAYQSTAPQSELRFAGNIASYEGVQSEPIVFDGGTLILDNVQMNNLGQQHAITIRGNTQLQLVGKNTLQASEGYTAIYVEKGAALEITGDELTAVGNAGSDAGSGGHGIGGYGSIFIHDVKTLAARGFGTNAFGIGGPTSSITIKNTYISSVQGGHVGTDNNGGAAIGSHTNGATIVLENVTIESALGGGKSAGIGAMYHTGVTVDIKDSTITHVSGGYGSAGIGGSIVGSTDPQDQDVTVKIVNSKINATGGKYGAGIGSGYDPNNNPRATFPICNINIDAESVISATAGDYAAGVGTGYQSGGLSGEIKNLVTATGGGNPNDGRHTAAQDVGFGALTAAVTENNQCSITYVNNPVKSAEK